MPSRSVKFKAYHGEKGEFLDNDDTWMELAGFRVTEFVLLEPGKMDLVTAKGWFMRYLPQPLDPARPSCGDISISAVFSLSCTDIKWQQWPIETTADWRNWIRGCVHRRMPPVAVVDAIAKVPSNPQPPPQAPKAPFPTTALEIAAYTQAEQHAREIIARVDAQVSLLTVGASMSRGEHFAALQRVREAAKKLLAILRRGSSDVQPPPQPQPQANYRGLPPSFQPGYQPARPPPPPNTLRRQPQQQANTYLGLGLPPGCNLRQTNQPAAPPAPANQAAGGCGQPAPGLQGAANMALDSAFSTSASSPVQRGTPELPRPQNQKAASRPKKTKAATPPATAGQQQVVGGTGRGRQSVMVTPQGTPPCWFPPPAGKRARPNPTTTRPTVGAAADAEASPAPATGGGGGSGVGGI